MLVMITAFSAVATTGKQEQSSLNQSTGSSWWIVYTVTNDPGYTTDDWWAYASCVFLWFILSGIMKCLQNVTGPIRVFTGGV